MTPLDLAELLVKHFNPTGRVLEPCKGTGNFIKALEGYGQNVSILWCEITKGRDFTEFKGKVDWIITNPPWSKIRIFLNKSMEVSDNVCFLFTINHLWTKARLRDIKEKGFGIKEICIFDRPDNFPPLGFQLGMVHLQRGYSEDIKLSELMYPFAQTQDGGGFRHTDKSVVSCLDFYKGAKGKKIMASWRNGIHSSGVYLKD